MRNKTRRFIAVFSSASFLNDFGSDMIYPVWPLFVTLLLRADVAVRARAIDPVQRTLVSELSPTKYRASVLGAFQMIVGLCALPASIIAGLLWLNLGMSAPFYFSLALTGLAVALMLFIKEQTRS